jgi:hypothetical protein
VAKWVTVVLAGIVLAGCGAEPRLSAGAADDLRRGVDDVRVAAGSGDRAGALRALKALRARVDRAADDGRLAEEDAVALRRGIARARRRVEQEVVAPQPQATPAPAPAATPEPVPAPTEGEKPEKPEKPGKDKHEGGSGREDDEEGDD